MQIYLRFYMFFFSFYFLGNAKTPQQCVEKVNRVPFIKMNILFLTVTGFWQPPKCVSMQSISSCSLYGISICSHLPIFLHRNTLTLQHLSKLFNAARRTTVEEAISWWLMLKSRWGVAVDVGFLLVGLCWLSVTCVWWNHEYLVISRTWKNSVKSRHHYLGHESKQKKSCGAVAEISYQVGTVNHQVKECWSTATWRFPTTLTRWTVGRSGFPQDTKDDLEKSYTQKNTAKQPFNSEAIGNKLSCTSPSCHYCGFPFSTPQRTIDLGAGCNIFSKFQKKKYVSSLLNTSFSPTPSRAGRTHPTHRPFSSYSLRRSGSLSTS